MELNFEGLEMQKWNIPMDGLKDQKRKTGLFVQLSCLLPELWSSKCQKWLMFCIFCQ